MGSFSWLKADRLTKISNIYYGCSFKFLIPKIYGSGSIKDHYQDYGYLGTKDNGGPKYDMYELLAFWNSHVKDKYSSDGKIIADNLNWFGKEDGVPMPYLKEIDKFTNKNRVYGINIGCYDKQIKKLMYPLKLVSVRNNQNYEECEEISLGDPYQGFFKVSWEKIDQERQKTEEEYEASIKREVAKEVEIQKKVIGSINEIDLTAEEIDIFIKDFAEKKEKQIRSRYE